MSPSGLVGWHCVPFMRGRLKLREAETQDYAAKKWESWESKLTCLPQSGLVPVTAAQAQRGLCPHLVLVGGQWEGESSAPRSRLGPQTSPVSYPPSPPGAGAWGGGQQGGSEQLLRCQPWKWPHAPAHTTRGLAPCAALSPVPVQVGSRLWLCTVLQFGQTSKEWNPGELPSPGAGMQELGI